MVTVKIYRNRDDYIVKFQVSGHAAFDEEGRDIVCAGISMVAQTAVLGLMNHLPVPPEFERKKGHLSCEMPSGLGPEAQEKAQVILTTMEAGLLALEAGYPGYVKVIRQGGVNGVQD